MRGYIRPARSFDTEGMRAVVHDRPTISAKLSGWLTNSYVYALDDGVIAGFVSRGAAKCDIHALYVRDDFREQGIGERLLTHVEEIIRAEGEICARLFVESDNVKARDYYLKRGYSDTGTGQNGWILHKNFRPTSFHEIPL